MPAEGRNTLDVNATTGQIIISNVDVVGPHQPLGSDVRPRRSNLKPSNFDHPILIDPSPRMLSRETLSNESFDDRNEPKSQEAILLSVINLKLIGGTSILEKVVKQAIDILTFPVPVTTSTNIELCGRFKVCIVIIVTALAKMAKQKSEDGQRILTKDSTLKSLYELLKAIEKLAQEFATNCRKLAKRNRKDFETWASLLHGAVECVKPSNKRPILLYEGELGFPTPSGVDIFENLVHTFREKVTIECTNAALHILPDINFIELPSKCQIDFLKEVGVFGEGVLLQSNILLKSCLSHLDKDSESELIQTGYATISRRLQEHQYQLNIHQFGAEAEFRNALLNLTKRKTDLLNLSYAAEQQAESLCKGIRGTRKFTKQVYDGDTDPEHRRHICLNCCNPFIDSKELVLTLCGLDKQWSLELTFPMSPKMAELITLCKEKQKQSVSGNSRR